jgi:aerobic-type carbon monoxide dehydrogenase small subunit (CoxS/CutS family)
LWREQVYHFSNDVQQILLAAFSPWSFAMAKIQLAINGRGYSIETDPQTSLLTVLREHLDLTGSKYGCGEGMCGACTVEGLATGEQLHPVQQAFLDAGAMQCAYCTSGMIMSAVALLKKNPAPNEGEIIDFMDGNVCRCGTYSRIVSAIQSAAKMHGPAMAKGASR